jgi:hypothetical protein
VSTLLTLVVIPVLYYAAMTMVKASGAAGDFKAAIAQLDQRNPSPEDKKELLYNMERGELLRLDRRYGQSTDAFLLADAKVNAWEEAAKTDPQRLMGMVGASLISERMKEYEGQDYEKVWLTTRIAMNRIGQSDFDKARVDIKRTHEREAVIAGVSFQGDLRSGSRGQGKGSADHQHRIERLSGRNAERSGSARAQERLSECALSHYLAGFLYESLNESGLAAPGYRKAIELRPGVGVLEDGLSGLDSRTSVTWKRKQRQTDVLFLVEYGTAPARVPKAFTIPVPVRSGIRTVSISYPTIDPSKSPQLSSLTVADKTLPLGSVVDLNLMARRVLKDEMPGMVLRGVTRAIAKGRGAR